MCTSVGLGGMGAKRVQKNQIQGFSVFEVKLQFTIPYHRKWHFWGSNFQNRLGAYSWIPYRELAPLALESLGSQFT